MKNNDLIGCQVTSSYINSHMFVCVLHIQTLAQQQPNPKKSYTMQVLLWRVCVSLIGGKIWAIQPSSSPCRAEKTNRQEVKHKETFWTEGEETGQDHIHQRRQDKDTIHTDDEETRTPFTQREKRQGQYLHKESRKKDTIHNKGEETRTPFTHHSH